MKSIKYTIATACIALTACGGGGGGGGSDKSFFGTWKGDLFLVNNSAGCPRELVFDSINRTIVIGQKQPGRVSDATVDILGEEVNGAGYFEGEAISASFFEQCYDNCIKSRTVSLTPDGDGTASLDYTIRFELAGPNSCTIKYTGQVTRE